MRSRAIVSSIASRKIRFAFAAGCAGLAIAGVAIAEPAPHAKPVVKHADAQRAAQLRHARNVQGAARRLATAVVRHPAAASIYTAQASSPDERRPLTGWPALVVEARKYLGTNPTARKRLWCATFMNFVLAKTGYAGTGSDAAKSFASYGRRVNEPKIGAIAVLTRGKRGGHVGIVTGIDANGNPIIISGNHGHRVGEGTYPRSRVIAYVMPTGRGPATQLAQAGSVGGARMSDAEPEGLSSPIDELLAAINAERASHETERATPRPVAVAAAPAVHPTTVALSAVSRPVPQAAVAHASVPTPPVRYRVVQQMPANDVAEREPPRQRFAEVRLPPQRAAVPGTPLPRTRPATP